MLQLSILFYFHSIYSSTLFEVLTHLNGLKLLDYRFYECCHWLRDLIVPLILRMSFIPTSLDVCTLMHVGELIGLAALAKTFSVSAYTPMKQRWVLQIIKPITHENALDKYYGVSSRDLNDKFRCLDIDEKRLDS